MHELIADIYEQLKSLHPQRFNYSLNYYLDGGQPPRIMDAGDEYYDLFDLVTDITGKAIAVRWVEGRSWDEAQTEKFITEVVRLSLSEEGRLVVTP